RDTRWPTDQCRGAARRPYRRGWRLNMPTKLASRLAAFAVVIALSACAQHLAQPRDYIVYFDTDSATLTTDGQRIVATAASAAHDTSPAKILVAGRADGSTAHD